MDSESQEPIQEHILQTEEDKKPPSTGDNLPTKPEQEDDRGVVSNSTFHIAGQPHLDPENYDSKLEQPEIEQIPSNGRPADEDVHSGTTEKDSEPHIKEEETTEVIPEHRTNHDPEADDVVEQSEQSNPFADQDPGDFQSILEESAFHAISAGNSAMNESHNGEQGATGFDSMEESREEGGESQFFDDIQPPENNPFDYLDQEAGTNGLDSAEHWPTEDPEDTNFQLGEEVSQPRNPFDQISEDPEFGESIFGTKGAFEQDDRPDPESQGYTLLQNDDDAANDDQFDPEMGNTSADVHDAQVGGNMTSSHESQQDSHREEQVAAFSQVHEPLSQGVTGLEFVAHQLVDPSDNVPQEIHSETEGHKEVSGERWWSSNEIGDKFNFGQQDEQQSSPNAFEPDSASEHLPVKTEDSQDDQFFQLLASDEPQQSSAPKDEPEVEDLFYDESIAELFPSQSKPVVPHQLTETSPPSVPAPVSSLFGETPDAPNLFNSPDNFPIAPIKEPIASLEQQTSEAGVSENFATEELVDDLDFIDDSEFMAAFGATPSATPAIPPPPPPSAPAQLNGTSQTQPSRYLPQQALPKQAPPQTPYFPQETPISPPQSQYFPQQSHQVGSGAVPSSMSSPNQPSTVPSQQSRTVSSRYAPAAAPRPAPATGSATVSPQVPVTQPTWSQQPTGAQIAQPAWSQQQQQAAPSPPRPKQPPGRSASSFVTAKGAYASPYDLPPQIASKPKRHIPPPIPTYQQAPPPADVRSPLVAGPPQRAVSSQARFPPPQSQRPVPPGPQTPNQYAPPNVASPPLRSPLVQNQPQNDPRGVVSPPTQYQQPPSQQPLQGQTYTARRESFPPPQQGFYGAPTSPPVQQSQPGYAPGRMVSPPNPMSPQYQTTVPQVPQQSVSPPIRAPSTSRYATGSNLPPQRSVSTQHQKIPTDEPWQLHAPGPNFSQGRQRSVVSPPPSQPYQPRVASPLSHQHVTSQEHHGYLPPPQHHPLHPNQAPLGAQNPYQQPPQRQFPPPTESQSHFPPHEQYPPPHVGVQYAQNEHDDLPPHFEMERDDWEQRYGPEDMGAPPMFVPERNVIQTPEPIDGHQDPLNDVSPPRPWERAASLQDHQQQDFSKPSRPFSPYEPREPAPALLIPQMAPQQAVTERHRSVSPQVTRTSISSPKREFSMDKAQSYPSRKPPAHLRQATGPLPPRTLEEDFQFRRGGFPIVNFGFGGRMITMIPRTPHRLTMYGAAPLSVPGSITFSSLRDVIEPPGFASTFPGPLFSATKAVKGKGKEIAKWLDDNLAHQDQVRDISGLDEQELHRIEDRKVLFKLLKLLVDNNGVLEGTADLEKSIKDILLPQIANVDNTEESKTFGVTASALANTAATQSTTVDPNALATYNLTSDFLRSMRTLLMQGDRPNAIRKAVDQKMWGHALLIASSVNQTVWRDTVEQFIRSELRGSETKDFDSLRFLYGLLGGEAEHAVNELLPPINRMVSSIHSSATSQAPRFGSWKESAGMVILNKGSMDCSPSLLGLGTSLVKENRVEAGHACFLLVRFAAKFSAADAPDSHYTVIGADQSLGTVGLPQVLLSEVFEYSQSKFAPEGFLHLIPYKLWHAWTLVDYGYSDLAEKYCESIGATLQKEKRGSVFITPTMIHMLRELTERLAESSQPGSTEKSSWFGKKSSRGDTFWKALETNLTKFVAGDEVSEEATPTSNGKKSLEVQDHRFGRIASDTNLNRMTSMPNLRAQATTPIYGAFPQDAQRQPGTHSRYNTATSESRYTPGARYEQISAPGVPVQELDAGRSGYRPSSGYASPDPTNGGYSPYISQQPAQPSPFTPTPEIVQPPAEEEPPFQPEEKPSHPRQESEESDKSTKGKEKKAIEHKPSGGWFGGWFKRGSAEQPVESTPGKPIKAKLGEESSFYYDKDLKRWVNKKSGDVPAKAAPPPPPPKRAVGKTPSTATPPVPSVVTPSTPVALASTIMTQPPAPTPSMSAPAATATPPTTMATPSALPPSRPASSALPAPPHQVDPLEALLAGRPASGARGAKKPARSRYIDVMNKK